MGTCPNCSRTAIFLRRIPCKVCGKYACDKCAFYLFSLANHSGQLLDTWDVCSKKCMETLARKFEEQISPEQIPIYEADAINKIPFLVQQFMISPENRTWLDDYYIYRVSKGKAFHVNFAAPYGTELYR